MKSVLFVANGHGENAIAARIAADVAAHAAEPLGLDLLSLVGMGSGTTHLRIVGPRRVLPSEGLLAMGNVTALARDVIAGFPALLTSQLAFLARTRRRYAAAVVVGDAYALAVALLAGLRPLFVGTAKSVLVARYGAFERVLLRRAQRVYVRDVATARDLEARRTPAEAPGNVIADLAGPQAAARPGSWIGLLPGSRRSAYADGLRLAAVARALGERRPQVGALFSIAPSLDAAKFAGVLEHDGWSIAAPSDRAEHDVPFEARCGTARLVAWRGAFGAFLAASRVVIGQAGTANEQAAAYGLPVIALETAASGREDWYRMRQRRLLGDGLLVAPPQPSAAAVALEALLSDTQRMAAMGAAGRSRIGPPGGARTIARDILAHVRSAG